MDRPAFWAWMLVCVLLPMNGAWVPVPLVIAVVLGLIIAVRDRPKLDMQLLWPLFAYYAMHVIGMAWTSDFGFGLFDLQIKAGSVVLPIAAIAIASIFPRLLHQSMLAFSLGSICAVMLGLIKAYTCYAGSGQVNCFSQSSLSFELHPSYAAWYACWVLAYWSHRLLSAPALVKWERILGLVMITIMLFWIMLLASKSGVIGLAVVVLYMFVLMVMKLRGGPRVAWISTAVALCAVTLWLQGPLVKARMGAAMDAMRSMVEHDPSIYTSAEGSDQRAVAWICSVACLNERPMGAGTGDIKHALMACYESKGATEAMSRRLNSHSQFLQGGVALGWAGLAFSVLLVLMPMLVGVYRKQPLLVLFAFLFLVNAAVESVFEVQAGVAFVGVMLGLFANVKKHDPT